VKNLTQAQEFLKADTQAQDDFVRRCEVVVTVSDDKFLPVKPLDRFCQTTDAAMECRMKVGMRLKETHARDGDMGKFCGAVYDWFQGKYGMQCPKQCRKLQCKSSCMWLGAKKKMNSENSQIKEDMMAAEVALRKIKALGVAVRDKSAEQKKREFTIKMIGVKIGRAKKALTEKTADQKAVQKKKSKVDKAYANLEKTLEKAEENIVKRDDALMKQKFAIDKAKLSLEAKAREAQRSMDKAKEDREEQKSLATESAKLGKEIAGLNKQGGALKKSLAVDQKAAKAQGAVVKSKTAKMAKAWKELDAFKASGLNVDEFADPNYEIKHRGVMNRAYKKDKRVGPLKELATNQYNRVKASEKVLLGLEKKMRDTNDEIKDINLAAARLTKQKKEADKLSNAAKAKADGLDKSAKAGIDSAKKFKAASITKPLVQMRKTQAAQKREQVSRDKAKKTLKFMGNLQKEQTAKVDAAAGQVSSAQTALGSQQKSLVQAKGWLSDAKKERASLAKQEKAEKATLAANEKAMMGRIKAYKKAVRDLDKYKPEIVRQHSLLPAL